MTSHVYSSSARSLVAIPAPHARMTSRRAGITCAGHGGGGAAPTAPHAAVAPLAAAPRPQQPCCCCCCCSCCCCCCSPSPLWRCSGPRASREVAEVVPAVGGGLGGAQNARKTNQKPANTPKSTQIGGAVSRWVGSTCKVIVQKVDNASKFLDGGSSRAACAMEGKMWHAGGGMRPRTGMKVEDLFQHSCTMKLGRRVERRSPRQKILKCRMFMLLGSHRRSATTPR